MGKIINRTSAKGKENIIKRMETLAGRHSLWEIWQDFVVMSAISIANAISGPYREDREATFLSHAGKYSSEEMVVFAQMLGELTEELEHSPEQDCLGSLFMELGLGSHWHGQFFTPYSVCQAMTEMTYDQNIKIEIGRKGFIAVSDPACGAGALLIAFANKCRQDHDVNYQTSVLFVAQDIDRMAGYMCYIQLSLLGCPGYVVIGDTLSSPLTSYDKRGLFPRGGPNIWYTPMYYRGIWHGRREAARMDLFLSKSFGKGKPVNQAEKAGSDQKKNESLFPKSKLSN